MTSVDSAPARLPWVDGDTEVLDVLLARRAAGSTPRDRDDSHHVTLVVEGGGMRGAYIGGMIRSLSFLGLGPCFDDVYAVSAGAFSATGLALGRVDHSVSVYADDLALGGFVSWPRFLARRGPLISLDFLIDEVMGRRLGLDFDSLSGAEPTLYPVATDLDSLQAVALTGLAGDRQWRQGLRASATVPVFAGPPVELHGRRYVDGFVADSLPLARAIAAGATHVLALVARAPGERLRAGNPRGHTAFTRIYDRVAPGLAALMAERATSYADSLAIVHDRNHRHRAGAYVAAVRPTHATGVSSLTSDPAKLWQAGTAGEAAIRATFAGIP